MRQKLTATRPMRYATRALQAGDEFEASRQDARVLTALGRARPAQAVAPQDGDDAPDPLDALRAEAEAAGVDVDKRWGEKRLRTEIAKATEGRYERRDMRAED